MRSSLAIVGVSGLIVGLSTWFVVKLQRAEIEQSKIEFDSYKLEAGKKISDADARAAEATLKANEADLARVKLEERISPRRLKQPEQDIVASKISDFKGQIGQIGSSPRDIESMRLESAIHGALAGGGWVVTRGIPTHTPMWPGGVVVASTLHPRGMAAAAALASALIALVYMPPQRRYWRLKLI